MTRPKKRIEPTKSAVEPAEPVSQLFTHTLLPGDGEKPAPKVLRFFVTRKNEKTGQWEYAPSAFGAHDLPGPDALFQAYGGGYYWIRGQDETGFVAPFGVWPLAGASKPLAPNAEPETPPAAAPPTALPMNAAGGFDMGAMFLLFMQGQQAQQAETTKLMGTIITAVLSNRTAPPTADPTSGRLIDALLARNTPGEAGAILQQLQGAWKDGVGIGAKAAELAAEAQAAGNAAPEPSGLDKALDAIAPAALGKMMDKVMGG